MAMKQKGSMPSLPRPKSYIVLSYDPGSPDLAVSFLSAKNLRHRLLRQFDAQESRRIRWHGSGQRWAQTREERLEPATRMDLPDGARNRRIALRALQPALDRINWEDGDPHSHTSRTTGGHDGRQTQLAGCAIRVLGGQAALDDLVGGEVGGAARSVAGKGHGGAAEDGADAALFVELANDVEAAAVLWLLAGRELLLTLDLEEHLDTLEGRGNERHGDGGEEAGGGGLRDGELVVVHGADRGDELLADVVTPEGDGDCARSMSVSLGRPWRSWDGKRTYT